MSGGTGGGRAGAHQWDEWFATSDENDLAMLYQEEKASGEDSTFFTLVER
ncbi:hypothetical protein [Desertihabitans aurantiacus]|nr:hypothetical protein [Desertihabitans aurantiacus]